MFEDSLLESSGQGSRIYRTGPAAPLATLAIQAGVVATFLLMPLLFTQQLPSLHWETPIVAPRAPKPDVVQIVSTTREHLSSAVQHTAALIAPGRIPPRIDTTPEEPVPFASLPSDPAAFTVPGGTGDSPSRLDHLLATARPAPIVRSAAPARLKVSEGVTAGMLIFRVQPVYPSIAREARISGEVLLQAVIAKDGSIQSLHAVSGHPWLAQSAIAAVRQWHYQPFLLNGEPVEVDTQIKVNFSLGR